VRRELLDSLCHEAGNYGFIVHGIIKKLVKLQDFPIKNRKEIETLHKELLNRSTEFFKYTGKFRTRAIENGSIEEG